MDGLDLILNELETAINKLEGWYNYYKDEDMPFEGAMAESHSNLMEGIERNIQGFKSDCALLKLGATILKAEIAIHSMMNKRA